MTRTAHHLRPSRTRKSYDDGPDAPWHSVILNDLRYSARSLTEAAAEARRPWPQRIRRRVSVHRFPATTATEGSRAPPPTTAAGAVEVKAPRVNEKRVDEATGERKRFSSVNLPPWCRKSPRISEVLPLLYPHGLSTGDFVPALEQFPGSPAGLSPATVTG